MKFVGVSLLVAVAVSSLAGCGSDSTASASFPRTATPVALQQVATPKPTATLLPGP